MELQTLTRAIWNTSQKIDKNINNLTSMARKYSEAEKQYRLELAKEIIKLRTKGVQATLIPDIARGNIADIKFNRDLAETEYKAYKQILKNHFRIREINRQNADINYLFRNMDTEYRLIAEMKYKEKLSLEKIGEKLCIDKSNVKRKKIR